MKSLTYLSMTMAVVAVSTPSALAQAKSPFPTPTSTRQKAPQRQERATTPKKAAHVPAGVKLPKGALLLTSIPRSDEQKERMKEEYAVITRGDEALKAGDTDGAIAAYLEARESQTQSGMALIRLAEAYTVAGRTEEAITAYRQLIYPPPGQDWSHANQLSPAMQMNFALLLIQTGQQQEALAAYRRALRTLNYDALGTPKLTVLLPDIGPGGLPYSPRLLRAMVCLGIGVDDSDNGSARLKEAAVLAPDSAAANYYLGKYLYAGGEPGAKAALERAIELGDASTAKAAKVYLPFSR